jgi:hypothetical protein
MGKKNISHTRPPDRTIIIRRLDMVGLMRGKKGDVQQWCCELAQRNPTWDCPDTEPFVIDDCPGWTDHRNVLLRIGWKSIDRSSAVWRASEVNRVVFDWVQSEEKTHVCHLLFEWNPTVFLFSLPDDDLVATKCWWLGTVKVYERLQILQLFAGVYRWRKIFWLFSVNIIWDHA